MSKTAMELHATTDASVWTDEFLRIFPEGTADRGTLLGWFANALVTGEDAARLSHDGGADAEPEDDDQWSVGYDEGFAAAKRLCAALEQAALSVPAPTLPALDAHHPDCAQMSKATKWWGDRYAATGDDFYRTTGRELVMDAEMFHQTHCGEALRDDV